MTRPALSHQAVLGPMLFALLFIATSIAFWGNAAGVVEHDASDPFVQCINKNNEPLQCLDSMGDPYNWSPSAAACGFVGGKVEAIIAAGGDAKWRDLFYNERCVRLGLPHSRTAAEPGDTIHPHARFWRCMGDTQSASNCWDILGRHASYPMVDLDSCSREIRTLRTRRGALDPLFRPGSWTMSDSLLWSAAFRNERCWRLGLPHYERR